MDKELDQILALRRAPAAPDGLAERIIAEALRQRAVKKFSLGEFWSIFADEFLIPQPAYAMAVVLVLGITAGFATDARAFFMDPNAETMAVYEAVDHSIEDGVIL